jgi:hypothetical protein
MQLNNEIRSKFVMLHAERRLEMKSILRTQKTQQTKEEN